MAGCVCSGRKGNIWIEFPHVHCVRGGIGGWVWGQAEGKALAQHIRELSETLGPMRSGVMAGGHGSCCGQVCSQLAAVGQTYPGDLWKRRTKYSDVVMGNREKMQSSSQAEASKISGVLQGVNGRGIPS